MERGLSGVGKGHGPEDRLITSKPSSSSVRRAESIVTRAMKPRVQVNTHRSTSFIHVRDEKHSERETSTKAWQDALCCISEN